jgi:NitT/TauT family transport system substrate-binding protein
MTRDDFIKKRPRAVERLLKALIEAEEYVSAHAPEAQTFMAERLGYDRILMQSLWSRSDFRVRLDQDLLILMEDETRWSLRRTHLKKDMPNYLNVIHWDSLKNIRPEAVSVIH